MAFHALERLIHLHDGYRRTFSIAGNSLLLVQDNGQRYLLINQCPHQQAPLHQATIQDGELQCPAHGMRFNLLTGQTNDGCSARLKFLPVIYEGNTLGVNL